MRRLVQTAFVVYIFASISPTSEAGEKPGGGSGIADMADTPSVGEFLVQYAQTMRLAGESATADVALAALLAAGAVADRTFELKAPLSEGDVVRITSSMNLGISTEKPDQPFTKAQVLTFFTIFAPVLQNGHIGDPNNLLLLGVGSGCPPACNTHNGKGADPRTRGKGRKEGLSNHFP